MHFFPFSFYSSSLFSSLFFFLVKGLSRFRLYFSSGSVVVFSFFFLFKFFRSFDFLLFQFLLSNFFLFRLFLLSFAFISLKFFLLHFFPFRLSLSLSFCLCLSVCLSLSLSPFFFVQAISFFRLYPSSVPSRRLTFLPSFLFLLSVHLFYQTVRKHH